jgi:acyl dehydratase
MTDRALDRPPSSLAAFARAIAGARRPVHASRAPDLALALRGVAIDPRHLARFRTASGSPDGPGVPAPPTYAQALAWPLHLALYTDPAFPLRALGTVHLALRVREVRPLRAGERLDLRVALAALRDGPRGAETDVATEVRDASGALVWSSTSTALAPDPRRPRAARPPSARLPDRPRAEELVAPAGTGRAWARASGDWNPIHLHPLAARPFGFRRAVAHGAWTLARALAAVTRDLGCAGEDRPPLDVRAEFLRPLLLPGRARVCWTPTPDGAELDVRTAEGDAAHLAGSVRIPG